MTEFASTDCQKYCGVVKGSVNDVCEFGDVVAFVQHKDGEAKRTSEPLADLAEDTPLYLEAVQKCPGAEAVSSLLGFKKRMKSCNAKLGECSLAKFVIRE